MTTALAKKNLAPAFLPGYSRLLGQVRKALLKGQKQIEAVKVRTYWQAGKLIHTEILKGKDRADYGKQIILRLSRDLQLGDAVIYRMIALFEAYPIYSTSSKLTWSHYTALLGLDSQNTRQTLESQAIAQNWTVQTLEEKIKALKAKDRVPKSRDLSKTASQKLKPRQGRLGVFKIVRDPADSSLALDWGFSVYETLTERELKNFDVGDFVSQKPDGSLYKTPRAQKNDLYHFEAQVLRVVDGDTVWLRIWLAQNLSSGSRRGWLRQKLRLRAIDAAELKTPKGEAAKRFLENLLKNNPRVVVTTTASPDKWDRYLADLFLPRPEGDLYVNQHLLNSGQALPA